MIKVTSIRLEDGTVIYVEAIEELDASSVSAEESAPDEEQAPIKKGNQRKPMGASFEAIEGTIRAYTNYTLNAFKQVAIANVDKVTLEFGIQISSEAGIPYVTKGTAQSNLKITVECSFPDETEKKPDKNL